MLALHTALDVYLGSQSTTMQVKALLIELHLLFNPQHYPWYASFIFQFHVG